MDFHDTSELAAYRATVREWLRRHRHHAPPRPSTGLARDDEQAVEPRRAWQRRLAEAGLVGVTWPVAYGGRELSLDHQLVVEQELEAAQVAGAFDIIGVGMLGPAIIAHGSEAQRSRHLAPMLRGDEVWCQLFSEPAAGSDLAAVRTSARRLPGGGWSVSGQKVWTSNASHARFGLLLARTDFDVPKHRGLTAFVIDMRAQGVTVRPLRQISGEARFAEVFFDEVRLPEEAVVGAVGGGWRVAVDTLAGERLAIGRTADSLRRGAGEFAAALAAHFAAKEDPVLRRRFGEIASELLALPFAHRRAMAAARRGSPDPAGALAKITAVEATTRAADLICDALGPGALDDREEWARLVSDLPGLRSAGGTEEIVRSLVAERALGLPPEPRGDKDIPFSELPTEPFPEA